eukprot:SAG11_NODE_3167_length_2638_cov_4.451359_3_plen_42_part_00
MYDWYMHMSGFIVCYTVVISELILRIPLRMYMYQVSMILLA